MKRRILHSVPHQSPSQCASHQWASLQYRISLLSSLQQWRIDQEFHRSPRDPTGKGRWFTPIVSLIFRDLDFHSDLLRFELCKWKHHHFIRSFTDLLLVGDIHRYDDSNEFEKVIYEEITCSTWTRQLGITPLIPHLLLGQNLWMGW